MAQGRCTQDLFTCTFFKQSRCEREAVNSGCPWACLLLELGSHRPWENSAPPGHFGDTGPSPDPAAQLPSDNTFENIPGDVAGVFVFYMNPEGWT